MNKLWFLVIILFIFGSTTSCVSLKRHKELEHRHQAVNALNDSCQAKQTRLMSQLDVLEQRYSSIQKINQGLMRDTARFNHDLRSARERIEQLDQQNAELARTSEILRKGSAAEQDQLLKELRETESKLRKREEDLALLERDVRSRETRIQEMQGMMDAQAQTLNNLRQTISRPSSALRRADSLFGSRTAGFTYRYLKNSCLRWAVPRWIQGVDRPYRSWARYWRATQTSTSWWRDTQTTRVAMP